MQQEEKYFLQKSSTKWARETYSRPLFLKKKKNFNRSKTSGLQLQYTSIALNLTYNNNKLYETFTSWSEHMFNFIMLYSINWPNFIIWNWSVAIIRRPGCDVVNLEINLIFLMKPFFLRNQKIKIKA